MGSALYATEPVFRASIDACDEVARELGVPLAQEFRGEGRAPPADRGQARRNRIVQLGIIQLALCDLWSAAGVEPDATLALSLGEMTACYAADALTRDEVVAVLCAVGQVVGEHIREGFLITIRADSGGALDVCHAAPRRLDFLGTTEPGTALLYTAAEDARVNAAFLVGRGLTPNRIPTPWPYHTMRSPYDLDALERTLAHLRPRTPRIPVFSALAGRDIAPDAVFDARHWHWMLGHRFWYDEAAAAALRGGPAVIVNIAAEPASTPFIRETARTLGIEVPIVDSMLRDHETDTWRRARAAIRRRPQRRRDPVRDLPSAPPAVDPVTLDLAAPGVVRDPFPYLEALRCAGPVHYLPRQRGWIVVRQAEVREALGQPELYSSQVMASVGLPVIGTDPPAHSEARRRLASRLGAAELAELVPIVSDAARALLDACADAVELDVVGGFSAPLGEHVAGRLLALDERQLARVRAAVGNPERPSDDLPPRVAHALAKAMPSHTPMDRLLWIASTTTTKRLITAAVLLLLSDQALRSRVAGDASLLPALIDEAGRLHPPEFMIPRLTTAEVRLGGVRIPAGSVVLLSAAAANRDPACYADPDRVDLERRGAHLTFGAGPHQCPGRRLARIEAEAAIAALLERMPNFRGAQPVCAMRWIRSATTHGLEQLMIDPGRP